MRAKFHKILVQKFGANHTLCVHIVKNITRKMLESRTILKLSPKYSLVLETRQGNGLVTPTFLKEIQTSLSQNLNVKKDLKDH